MLFKIWDLHLHLSYHLNSSPLTVNLRIHFENRKIPIRRKLHILINLLHPSLEIYSSSQKTFFKKKKKVHRKAFGDPQLHWIVKKRFRQSCFHATLVKFSLNFFCRTLLSVTSSPPDPALLIFEIFPSPEIFFNDLSSEQLQGCSESHCKMHRKTTGNRDLFLSEL